MVTAYYIMNLNKRRKNLDLSDYLSVRNKNNQFRTDSCRVCLDTGSVSLCDKNNSEILQTLQSLCNINIENDCSPKFLCSFCCSFIKSLIIFKQRVKETNEKLHQFLNEKSLFHELNGSGDIVNYNEKDHNYKEIQNTIQNITDGPSKSKVRINQKIQCKICNKVVNKSYYKEHTTMHDPNHFKYICDVCGKSFRLRCAYHNHSLRHRTDFPYKCQFCPYKGQYAELLRNHMKVHIGDYRYMCTECPARFLFKSNLNRHMFRHKEPQYTCDTCKKAFHTKLILQRHYEADHLGVRNHVCSICGKAFGYRNAMMKHQRHVHKREKLMFSRMPTYLRDTS